MLRPLVELLPLVSAAFLQVLERECGRQLAVAEWLRHEVRAQDLPAVEATIARLESVQRAAHAEVVRRMVSTPAGRIQ